MKVASDTSLKFTLGTILAGVYCLVIFLFLGIDQISKIAFYTVVALFWVTYDIVFMMKEGKIKSELFGDLTRIIVNPKFPVYYVTLVMCISIAVYIAKSCFDLILFVFNYGLSAFFNAFGAFGLLPFFLLIWGGLFPLYLSFKLLRNSVSRSAEKEGEMKILPRSSTVVGVICALISWCLSFLYLAVSSVTSYLFKVGVLALITLSSLFVFLAIKDKFILVSRAENILIIFLHINFWLPILFYAWNNISFFGFVIFIMIMTYLIGVLGVYLFIWGETIGMQTRLRYFSLAIIEVGFAIQLFLVGGVWIAFAILVFIRFLINIAGFLYGHKGENKMAFYSGIFGSYEDIEARNRMVCVD